VRLRRQEDGTFKGSVFVEFVDADSAKQFLEMEEKPKFNDQELEVMSKQAYVENKNQAILEGTVKPKSPTRYGSGGNRYNGNRDNRERRGSFLHKRKRENDDDDDDGDKDNWRSRREKFQRGGGRNGRDRKESRSRSPYQAPKKDEGATEDAKMEDASETKKEGASTETKTEVKDETKTETTETKKDAEETSA
jgi:lupus La protein